MHALFNQLHAYVIFTYLSTGLRAKSSEEYGKKKIKNTKRHAFNNVKIVSSPDKVQLPS